MRTLMNAREKRAEELRDTAKVVGQLSGVIGGATALGAKILYNPSFNQGVKVLAISAAGTAVIGAAVGTVSRIKPEMKRVREATHLVWKGLLEAAEENRDLKSLLKRWPYVIVDKEGNIVGTNRQRFLKIGRVRLETNKILTGKY